MNELIAKVCRELGFDPDLEFSNGQTVHNVFESYIQLAVERVEDMEEEEIEEQEAEEQELADETDD